NGLAFPEGWNQPFERGMPVGMVIDGAPGRLDQHGPQLATTLLGDRPGVMRLTRGVDASTQATVADEFLSGGEPGKVADGGEARHGGDDSESWQLHEKGSELLPGILGAQARQFGIDRDDEALDRLQEGEILLDAQALYGGQGDLVPPRLLSHAAQP